MLRIGLLGLGTVGTALVRLLRAEGEVISRRAAMPLLLRRIAVAHPERPRSLPLERDLLTDDGWSVIRDPDVDVVVELIGGLEPARSYMLAALGLGKPVVTANKQVVARYGRELTKVAAATGAELYYEASVAGGIPIIRTIREGLSGTHITEVAAILNGTTNYILTRMEQDGVSSEEALKEAQELGYAERDPTEDLAGHDAAAKLSILASIAFDANVAADDVPTASIASVTQQEVAYVRELGYTLKQLAHARDRGEAIELGVYPALVPLGHPLASVRHESNAVWLRTDGAGDMMLIGSGAGGGPAASAVLSDLIAVARERSPRAPRRPGWMGVARRTILSRDATLPFFLVLRVADRPGVFAKVAAAFGEEGVSLHSIVQENRGVEADVVLRTHETPEPAMLNVMTQLQQLEAVRQVSPLFRVLEL